MMNFSEQIERTEERFNNRQEMRDKTRELLKTSPLTADEPQQIEKRLSRLGRRPVTESLSATVDSELAAAPAGGGAEPATLERLIGNSDLVGIGYLEQALKVGGAVGRIVIRGHSGNVIGFGTGFMVSPHLLLTNNHVLESASAAAGSLVQFNYQLDWLGQEQPSPQFALEPQRFFLTEAALDYSLVAVRDLSLDGRTSLQQFGWCFLSEETGKVINGESLNIIQHPNGERKQVAFRENKLIDRLENFLHYETDTAPGSSGSPVFNDQWEVVALHHSGVPARDANGRILAIDGSVWREEMGEQRVKWIANEGVRISRLVSHIKGQTLPPEAEALRAEWLANVPNFAGETSLTLTGGAPAATIPQSTINNTGNFTNSNTDHNMTKKQFAAPLGEGTKITWRIPLEVTIDLGRPEIVTPGIAAVNDPASFDAAPPKDAAAADANDALLLKSALARLEDSRTGEYYNEAKDRENREAYYQGLDTQASPENFYQQLSRLVSRTHTTRLTYKPAVHLYPDVDLHPDRTIHSIYSGTEFAPEELIRADFRIDRERAARLRETALRETAWGAEKLVQEIDLLEASMPFNCEHTVPQSWFGKREPMRGDLHHLFACETGCNSFRSNIPYFDFADFGETVRNDCGKRDGNKFEPSGGKGQVARAVMYFLLRYPGEINRTSNEYTEDRLLIFRDWHREFPPEQYELHRNSVIFAKQGNRNPLIDFPDWAERIDFRLGLG